MAKKYHYYVLVFTSTGPVYVTSINRDNKYARWDRDQEPLELSFGFAEDLVMGLNCNFYNSVLIKSPIKICYQPYRYEAFDCIFTEKTDGGN